MSALVDYLRAHIGKPFVWGESDCSTFAKGWAELIGALPAPIAIATSPPAYARLERVAPLPARLREWAQRAGAQEVDAAIPGDIAVITQDGRQVLAIAVKDGFAVRVEGGIEIRDASPEAVVRVFPCRP